MRIYTPTYRHQGLQGYTRWGWGSVGRIYVPAPHPDKCLSYKGVVKCEEGLDSASCLLHPSFLIRAEAHVYLLAEFLDGPLGPLRERSFPSTNGRPSLITNPSLPHLLTQGGGLGIWVLSLKRVF